MILAIHWLAAAFIGATLAFAAIVVVKTRQEAKRCGCGGVFHCKRVNR